MSPHVEMSDRLEAGSKIFKTPINLSHWFALSPAARHVLRIVDRVTMPGVDRIVDMPRNNSTGMTVSKASVPVTIRLTSLILADSRAFFYIPGRIPNLAADSCRLEQRYRAGRSCVSEKINSRTILHLL